MPRQKLSEFRAKKIISEALDLPYSGWPIDAQAPLASQTEGIDRQASYVLKVDEGVKGRFKKGLVELGIKADDLPEAVKRLQDKGYQWLIAEPMVEHDQKDERYISLVSDRVGLILQFTSSGGVDIEKHADSVKKVRLNEEVDWKKLAEQTGIDSTQLKQMVQAFKDNYFVFMEINPYLAGENLRILDIAVEADDTAAFFVDKWRAEDFRKHTAHDLTEQERTVQLLDAKSPASLKLEVLEPNGGIFLLLSGGGASVLVADEIYNQGYGKQLGNYGEYSGNPNTEETYAYTKAILQLLLRSSAPKKVLFIGGAVANFTDIAKTFAGVIQAIDEVSDKLREQNVKVFVRRGGPNQETGLKQMEDCLKRHDLLGAVHDPGTPLTEAVTEALEVAPK
jgi:ATP-citrate lyase beta-subunit